jgi:hypothetical protein
VLEIVNNGHVDGLAILLSVAALTVVSPPPDRVPGWPPARREVLAGGLVGLAILVKYPALVVVAIAAGSPDTRRRSLRRVGGTALGVCIAGYLPHVMAVGHRVIGFLPGYFREEHSDGAGRYLVAGAARLPGGVAPAASALAVVVALTWVWVGRALSLDPPLVDFSGVVVRGEAGPGPSYLDPGSGRSGGRPDVSSVRTIHHRIGPGAGTVCAMGGGSGLPAEVLCASGTR